MKTAERIAIVEEIFAIWVQEEFTRMGYRHDTIHTKKKNASSIAYVAEGHIEGASYTQRHFEVHCSCINFSLFIASISYRTMVCEYEYADPNCFEKLISDIKSWQGANLTPSPVPINHRWSFSGVG